jgi:hypothetical protein
MYRPAITACLMTSTIGILYLACSSRPAPARFSAKITMRENDNIVMTGQIYVDGWKYRMNLTRENERIGIIADRESDWTWLLMPDKKLCTYIDREDPENIASDPFLGIQHLESKYGRQATGDSTIDGYNCAGYVIEDNGKRLITYWESSDLRFPISITVHSNIDIVTELSDIVEGEIDDDVFTIPDDYTILARRWTARH